MLPEFDEFVLSLLVKCVQVAGDVPSHHDPLDEEAETLVDHYLRARISGGKPGRLMKRIALGMIPRLQYARSYGRVAVGLLDQQASVGDAAATQANAREYVLLELWRKQGRDLWSSGALGG
ncbi:MAG: hypothetical protein ACOVMP_03305 [Chthoniobacterales bacterium]